METKTTELRVKMEGAGIKFADVAKTLNLSATTVRRAVLGHDSSSKVYRYLSRRLHLPQATVRTLAQKELVQRVVTEQAA